MEIRKTYPEICDILTYNNLYFNYEDTELDENGIGSRTIIVGRDSNTSYICRMFIIAEPAEGSDQKDFDDNWAYKAGEKKFVYNSLSFDVASSDHKEYFKLKELDNTTDTEGFLYKGAFDVSDSAVRGDAISSYVIDRDNILGYGVDTIVGWLIRKKILGGGREIFHITPPQYDAFSSKRKIPSGLWLCINYVGSGTPNVIADYEYEY